jgi:hypothetical protein
MGLLQKHAGHNIGDIKDNLSIDLSDYVYPTKSGKDWETVIRKNEESSAKDQDS